MSSRDTVRAPIEKAGDQITSNRMSQRVASIDWMRGFVMVLMIVDHASMAFDAHHLDHDSAMYADAGTMALPGAEFFTRWITHLCAPTFVFLMGTSLALSVERRVVKGVNAWEIDKSMLTRGAIIALLDLTIISLGSGYWNFGVLFAIGVSMICMVPLRRLPTWAMLLLAIGWMFLGEILTGWFWVPPGNSSVPAALTVANYASSMLVIKYPVIPWLAISVLGWVFGRHLIRFAASQSKVSGRNVLWACGAVSLILFAVARGMRGYGDMFLHRADDSWQQWLHVSKYPPSLTYYALELGILFLCLAVLRTLELRIGVRQNGMFYVFGQTAMFFYIVHRLAFEVPATYFGLRDVYGLGATYGVSAVMLVLLYPACRWYRTVKAAHPQSILKYL
ncbi:DUF1624 domain-containing protein [Alloacidobacterium dinghuense]|nr:heparan-alpha-glucosaminide N-acetyltransferase domain-containing protein [Alloacidobacterium dinghuense]